MAQGGWPGDLICQSGVQKAKAFLRADHRKGRPRLSPSGRGLIGTGRTMGPNRSDDTAMRSAVSPSCPEGLDRAGGGLRPAAPEFPCAEPLRRISALYLSQAGLRPWPCQDQIKGTIPDQAALAYTHKTTNPCDYSFSARNFPPALCGWGAFFLLRGGMWPLRCVTS